MSFAITMLGILGERPRNAKPFFRAGPGVRAGCGVLGLDPLYLANEGKLICVLPGEKAAAALAAGVELVVIRRPRDRGEGLEDILAWFQADKEEAEWK